MKKCKKWVLANFAPDGYGFAGNPDDFREVAHFVLGVFRREKHCAGNMTQDSMEYFHDWASGLAPILGFDYFLSGAESKLILGWDALGSSERIITRQIYLALLQGEKEWLDAQ